MKSLPVYYTIADIQEFIEETDLSKINDDILDPDPIRYKWNDLTQLYTFYSFSTPCKKAVKELNIIIESVNTLDHELIRVWVADNLVFFKNNLFNFGYTYTDEAGGHSNDYYLPRHHLYIERIAFIPVLQYWQIMWNLYFGKYYLEKDQRKFTKPTSNDYYYLKPVSNAPSNIEVVKSILREIQ